MSGIGVSCERVSLELDGRRVLSRITLDLEPGAHCLLLGANGAGKTELMKLLGGARWPTPAAHARRVYRDARGRSLELPLLLPRIALVGSERQDKYLRYDWNFSVERIVATGVHGGDRPIVPLAAAARRRVRRLLTRLQLWQLRRRRFLTLSYGERRLTLLARALAAQPRLLLLDEPYNGLDRHCRRLLDRELARLARTRATVVLSAHRIEDAPRTFRRAIVLARGRIVHDGALAAAPPRWLPAAASDRVVHGGAPPRARRGRRTRPPPFVELRNVDLYRDYRPVIRGLDWTIAAGEHWAILGTNGSGKSTLLRFLYGDLPAALGAEVRRRGHLPGSHIDEWRRRVGLVSPELQAEYLERVSVAGLVVSGLRTTIGLELPPTVRELAHATKALRRVGLKVRPERPAHALSYGQRRLALIARALVRRPEALLLDEPLTGLDAGTRARVRRLLSSLARGGMQLIVAAHEACDLPPEVDRMLVLGAGRGTIRDRPG